MRDGRYTPEVRQAMAIGMAILGLQDSFKHPVEGLSESYPLVGLGVLVYITGDVVAAWQNASKETSQNELENVLSTKASDTKERPEEDNFKSYVLSRVCLPGGGLG